MKPFEMDLKDAAKKNDDFRRVLFTTAHTQLVAMAIEPGDEIGEEVHAVDQIFYIVKGDAEAVVDGIAQTLEKGELLVVPAGGRHNIRNATDEPLKLITIYAPPQHAAGTVQHTKAEASVAEPAK